MQQSIDRVVESWNIEKPKNSYTGFVKSIEPGKAVKKNIGDSGLCMFKGSTKHNILPKYIEIWSPVSLLSFRDIGNWTIQVVKHEQKL